MRRRAAGRWVVLGGVLTALSLTPRALPSSAAEAARATRLVIVSWDGAADWVVERLLAEGQLPHLAALAARGVKAEGSITAFPSKTAAGHAALWTGAWPVTNGITGNEVPLTPRHEHTLLEWRSGFSSEMLTAEPLFVTAAKAGRRVVVLSATQSYPEGPHVAALAAAGVPAEDYRSLSGFEHRIAPGEMLTAAAFGPPGRGWGHLARGALEATIEVGETTFFLLAYDDPADPTRGLDRLLVRQGDRRADRAVASAVLAPRAAGTTLSTADWSPPFALRKGELHGGTFFRLWALSPDGREIALYRRAASGLKGAISAAGLAAYEAAYPGFHDDPFPYYETSGLGTPIPLGGDGLAEERALELVAFDLDLATAGSRWAIEHWQPELLCHYTPLSDGAGHTWMGALDPAMSGHDPALAARLWPYYARVFALQDAWLGSLVAAAGPDAVVAVVSDHGMAGVRRFVYVNRVLEEAGLLAWDADGRIDLSRTRAASPYADFAVRLNGTDWQGGIVLPADRKGVIAAASEALLGLVDSATGRHVVPRVFRPDEAPGLGVGGPRAGELLFDLAPGYYPQQGPSPLAVGPTRLPWGEGHHGFWPERRDMQALFVAAGPGLAPGVRLAGVRHIDIAPTLARLLGIPPPPQATGRVIAEALSGEAPALARPRR